MSSDYEFAKKLIETPLDKRYNILVDMIEEHINKGNVRQSVIDRLRYCLKVLEPKKG